MDNIVNQMSDQNTIPMSLIASSSIYLIATGVIMYAFLGVMSRLTEHAIVRAGAAVLISVAAVVVTWPTSSALRVASR
jgi:hypothetical protein